MEAILTKLEDLEVRGRKTVIYRLQNVDAPTVANSITTFLTTERQQELQYQAANTLNSYEQIERQVVVVAEPTSNSLIISAAPEYFEEIRKIIGPIDERPPMVMIQVLIAEVTLDNTDEFGVELGLQDSVLFDRSLLNNPVFQTVTTTDTTGVQTSTETILGTDNTPGFNSSQASTPLGNSGSDKSLARPARLAPKACRTSTWAGPTPPWVTAV